VKAIDPATRTVTLTNADGEDVEVKCGKQVRNFDQLKVGDTVRAAAFARIVATMGNEPGADAADAITVVRTPEGGEPGAMVVRTRQRTAKIEAIDTEKRTVTLASAEDQKSRPIPVGKDLELSKLNVGDDITVRASKGIAIWVPQSDGARPAAARIPGGGETADPFESGTATVAAVDAAKGTVTIKNAQGRQRDIQLRPGSENFDRIKVGDKIGGIVVPEMAVAVEKAGAAPTRRSETSSGMTILESKGAKPGLLVADVDEVNGKIQSVDASARTITITEADGNARTLKTAPRVDLSDLKAGDEVTVRVTEVVGIKVENQ
jgi:hypothetical protein